MLGKLAADAGKSLLREIGEDMLKKGASTVIVEGVKSVIEVYKKRRMMLDEYEFQQWKKSKEGDTKTPKESSESDIKVPETAPEPPSPEPVEPVTPEPTFPVNPDPSAL